MGATEWDDPHDILPECFEREYAGCESVDEALAKAERRPSTTPEDEQRRCPVCGSIRVKFRGHVDIAHSHTEDWMCENCHARFDDPITPNDPETMHGTATTDDRVPFDWMKKSDLEDPGERTPVLSRLDDETLTALAIRAYEPWRDGGPSYRELADVLPYSRQWVGERVRAWKDGEYRDLVPDPREQATVDDTPSVDPFEYGETAAATDGGRDTSRWAAYGSD